MRALYIFSVWLHIISAAMWIGGMGFLALVIVPILRRPDQRGAAGALIAATGTRFRAIGWLSLVLLVVTGLFNLNNRGYDWADLFIGALFLGRYGRALLVKLSLVAIVLILSVIHDFLIGPKAADLMQRDPDSAEALRYRKAASWFGRVNMLLALAIVVFAVLFVRGGI